ncbi:MAG: hypothetical protein N2446_01265 [Elusimicrobiales bacterium]|nr:hypothetical protein [Elusimicrobiales bacterium]
MYQKTKILIISWFIFQCILLPLFYFNIEKKGREYQNEIESFLIQITNYVNKKETLFISHQFITKTMTQQEPRFLDISYNFDDFFTNIDIDTKEIYPIMYKKYLTGEKILLSIKKETLGKILDVIPNGVFFIKSTITNYSEPVYIFFNILKKNNDIEINFNKIYTIQELTQRIEKIEEEIDKLYISTNDTLIIPIPILLSNEVLKNTHTITNSMLYLSFGVKDTKNNEYIIANFYRNITIYPSNYIPLKNIELFSALVNPNDIKIKNFFSKYLLKNIGSNEFEIIKNLICILKSLGLEYTFTSIPILSETQKVQTPQETIILKRGQCSDLTVLFANLFSVFGINVTFLYQKDHILLMTEIEKEKVPNEYSKYLIEENGIFYLPIETTLIGKETFKKMIERGYYTYKNNTTSKLNLISAWKSFPPLPLEFNIDEQKINIEKNKIQTCMKN